MTEPEFAGDYRDREVQATFSVLIELAQISGAYLDRIVVVGGAVPWLLLPDAQPEHVGTIDIDLGLDPEGLRDGDYASFVESLEQGGYQRSLDALKKFQLRRWVTVDDGEPIAVLIDLLKPRGSKGDRNRPRLLEDFRVQDADGAGVALRHCQRRRLQGRMPDGRLNSVEIRIASIPALLVMKGFALAGRLKNKDAYDIYFSIRNYEGGPKALAAACQKMMEWEMTGAEPAVAGTGLRHIARKFQSRDDFGPQTVRRFMEKSNSLGIMTADQVQLDAFRQVTAWLRELELEI